MSDVRPQLCATIRAAVPELCNRDGELVRLGENGGLSPVNLETLHR
jgi:hypothetical protein